MKISLKLSFSIVVALAFCISANAQSNYTLQKALQTAKENNPALKSEQFEIGIAESEIISAKLRPNLTLENESLFLGQQSEFIPNTHWYNADNHQLWWQLSKSFQIAGQRKNKISVANKNVFLAEKEYAEAERTLYSEVASKWMEVWTAQKQLDIIHQAKSNIDSLVLTNQHRYKNEVITQTDLFRTELLAKQYALQSKTATQEVTNHLKELQFLLGVQDSITIDLSDESMLAIPVKLDTLLNQALERRSDILSAKSLIEVSNSNIDLQKSLAYPQPELGLLWNPQNTVQYFGFSASIDLPLFNRNQGEIKKSHLLKEQAEQQLITIERQLQTEITTAYASYHLQQQNSEDFKVVLQQSQTILENVKYAYLKGGTTIIDFLEAQRSWLETQQQYYDGLQQYRESYIQLLYATGLINQLAQ